MSTSYNIINHRINSTGESSRSLCMLRNANGRDKCFGVLTPKNNDLLNVQIQRRRERIGIDESPYSICGPATRIHVHVTDRCIQDKKEIGRGQSSPFHFSVKNTPLHCNRNILYKIIIRKIEFHRISYNINLLKNNKFRTYKRTLI